MQLGSRHAPVLITGNRFHLAPADFTVAPVDGDQASGGGAPLVVSAECAEAVGAVERVEEGDMDIEPDGIADDDPPRLFAWSYVKRLEGPPSHAWSAHLRRQGCAVGSTGEAEEQRRRDLVVAKAVEARRRTAEDEAPMRGSRAALPRGTRQREAWAAQPYSCAGSALVPSLPAREATRPWPRSRQLGEVWRRPAPRVCVWTLCI